MNIDKIEVKGSGKKTAALKFEQGLNVIAGASDTGKSYVTKCFQFIFGSDKAPKPIDQSTGYTSLEVTFRDNDNKRFLLSRELKDKADITCIELDNNNLKTILKPSHKGKKNLSYFFLRKIGLEDKVLVKGKESLNHATLTLRVLERLFLVDEERIISENSPLGTGQNTEHTLELSLFKTLLTGEDDSEIKNLKRRKKSKESIRQKINNLEEFLERFFVDIEQDPDQLDSLKKILESLEGSYNRADLELNATIESNNSLIRKRKEFGLTHEKLQQQIIDDEVLLGRFSLLLEKYISDKERLEANSEAVVYIEQQKLMNCPTCGSGISEDEDAIDVNLIMTSNRSEITKINNQIIDLRSTIEQIQQAYDKNKSRLSDIEANIQNIDQTLSAEIGEKLISLKEIVNEINTKKSQIKAKIENKKKRKDILTEIGKLQTERDEIVDIYKILDFSKESNEFSNAVAEILVRWSFPNATRTKFNPKDRDLIIGEKPRSHFGKGFRAICFSAFIIGLMEHLSSDGTHPGFVILDSPLTTYKKKDEDRITGDDSHEVRLSNNMINVFYKDLCNYYKKSQIIILDNQEPDKGLINIMNYIHFSGNENIGRYGFFPVS